MDKKVIMLGMIFGSMIGGYLPTIFGADAFSFTAIMCSALGGFIGIYLAVKVLN